MAGKIKQMIDAIIEQRTRNNPELIGVVRTKLMLKGVDPNRYTEASEDDPRIISILEGIIKTCS
jgi:hypothetical protein